MASIKEMNETRSAVREVVLAGGKIDLANATLIEDPATYAIPVKMDGQQYFVKVGITVAPWYDTKAITAFDLDTAVAKLEQTRAEKARKAAARSTAASKTPKKSQEEIDARNAEIVALKQDLLAFAATLDAPATATDFKNGVGSDETVMLVGTKLIELAKEGLLVQSKEGKKNIYALPDADAE